MLSPRPWKLEAVLRLAMGVFVCLFVGLLLAALLQAGGGHKPSLTLRQLIVSTLFFQGATIVWVGRFVREHELSWAAAFGLNNGRTRAIALGVLAVAVFFPIAGLLQNFSIEVLDQFGRKATEQSAVEVLRNIGQGPALPAFVLITVVVAPLGEELLFRGVLYPAVKHAGYPGLAWWGTSLLFAVIHFNLPILLPLFLLSLLLVWLYESTDNFLAPLTAHMLFNAVNLVIFFINGNPAATLPVKG